MKLISFELTKQQFQDRTKTVTRRMGWKNAYIGERLMGCDKIMGRRGEPLIRYHAIELTDVRRERLDLINLSPAWNEGYGMGEVYLEGFPEMTPEQFVAFFCKSHTGCKPETVITRLQFRHLT